MPWGTVLGPHPKCCAQQPKELKPQHLQGFNFLVSCAGILSIHRACCHAAQKEDQSSQSSGDHVTAAVSSRNLNVSQQDPAGWITWHQVTNVTRMNRMSQTSPYRVLIKRVCKELCQASCSTAHRKAIYCTCIGASNAVGSEAKSANSRADCLELGEGTSA